MSNENEPDERPKSSLYKTIAEWEQTIREQAEQRRKQQLRIAFSSFIFSTGAIIAGLLGYISVNRTHDLNRTTIVMETMADRLTALQDLSQIVSNRLSDLNAQILAVHTTNSSEVAILAEQSKINVHLQELDKRLSAMESAVLDSPEKSLAIPLIRKDLEDSGKRLDEFTLSIKSDMDRLYDQQKWMLGGIGAVLFTVAAGSIGIILKILFGSKDADKQLKLPIPEAERL